MEYLTSVHDKLEKIDESTVEYIDLFEHPEYVYGTINFASSITDFSKFPKKSQMEMEEFGGSAVKEMGDFHNSSSGTRLRFKTNSKWILFKVQLRRKWGYKKLVNWNAMGFDVYEITEDGEYSHMGVFGPKDGENVFAERIKVPSSGRLCIFLPNYNTIQECILGIDKGSSLETFEYPVEKRLPVLFYGNSVTQGAAASRSSNSFPNIVSKKLNRDIINLSVSSGCRGNENIADTIGKINCHSIIIDYTRNAGNLREFKEKYEPFYKRIRMYHPDKRIVLMTSTSFNKKRFYKKLDEHVVEIYEKAIERGENTKLLYQTELFDEEDYDLVTVDESHYIDWSMFRIAEKICELIE